MTTTSPYDILLKLVLVGDSGVGKTCLLLRYTEDTFSDTFITTIGVDFKIKTRLSPEGYSVKMQLWDTAGQDRFKAIVSSFYRGAHGLVLVFDVTEPESFEHIVNWLKEADHYGSDTNCHKLLVGNKVDLAKDRKVSSDEAQRLADSLGLKYVETSAKTSHQVHKALDDLADTIVKDYKEKGCLGFNPSHNPSGRYDSFSLDRTRDAENTGYCGGYCGGL